MKVLVYTEKKDFFKVIRLLCEDIHHSIMVEQISRSQLANNATSRNMNVIILDDRLYDTLSEECLEMMTKSQIKIIVYITMKEHIQRYLALNLLGYYVSTVIWDDLADRLKDEFRDSQTLKLFGPHFHKEKKLLVKNHSEISIINHNDILFMKRVKNSTLIHTKTHTYECHDSLKHLMVKLPACFMRVHNSYIVNFDNAKKIIDVGNRTYHVSFDDIENYAVVSRKRSEDILEHAINHYRMSFIDGMKG